MRRRLQRVSAVSMAVFLGLAVTSIGSSAQVDDRPLIWQGSAHAAGVHMYINTQPKLLPIDELIRADSPDGQSSWTSSGTAEARASAYYPGSSGTTGPKALCDFGFPCPPGFPPPYPLTTTAQYPQRPDNRTEDGTARVHAGLDYVASTASFSDNANADPNPFDPLAAVFTVGQVEAKTLQEFVDGVLVVRASSHLEDISIAAGAIHIESIDATSVSRTNGDDVTKQVTTFTVQGVTAGGQPATIDNEGVHIGGQGFDGDEAEANQALRNALAAAETEIRVLGARTDEQKGNTRGEAGGLLISTKISIENPGVPNPFPPEVPDPRAAFRNYIATFVFGTAGSHAYAVNDFGFPDPPTELPTEPTTEPTSEPTFEPSEDGTTGDTTTGGNPFSEEPTEEPSGTSGTTGGEPPPIGTTGDASGGSTSAEPPDVGTTGTGTTGGEPSPEVAPQDPGGPPAEGGDDGPGTQVAGRRAGLLGDVLADRFDILYIAGFAMSLMLFIATRMIPLALRR